MTDPGERPTRISTTSRPDGQRAIDRAAAARPVPGNRVSLLQDAEALTAMLAVIARATRFVHFENYIIRDDPTGWRFAEALAARAREGIAVRVLYDWFGSVNTGRKFWRFLRDAGCEVRAFGPPSLLKPFRMISRDHRKLVVADGALAVVGGLCIADEWTGDPAKGIPPWRDTALLIEGPASHALDLAFARIWARTGAPLPDNERAVDVPPVGDAAVRVVVGEPGKERAYRVLEYLAAECRRRLWVVDAYFIPPQRLFEVLALAEKDGVDIRFLVPGSSDVPLLRNLTRIGYRDLLRAGIRIFEWDGPMIHGKTMVADGRWVRVGTSNINASSLTGNYELDLVVEDPELARAMEHQFRRDLGGSAEVVRQKRRAPRAFEHVIPSRLATQGARELPRRRGRRELRARTMIAARRLMTAAFRSVVGPISLGLLVLGMLFLGLPKIMGYFFGGLCLWFALATGLQVWRRREST